MFTLLAAIWRAQIAHAVDSFNVGDRADPEPRPDSPYAIYWHLVLHIRQDLKFIAFQLFAVLIALGVIVDFFQVRWR
jgi:hypothetical protein